MTEFWKLKISHVTQTDNQLCINAVCVEIKVVCQPKTKKEKINSGENITKAFENFYTQCRVLHQK
jgi:hypothetical protein